MKFIHTADLHIGKSRKIPDYLDRQRQMVESIFEAAERFADKLLLIGGDIFDRPDLLPREKDMFIEHLCKADQKGITTVMISGNHDMLDEDDGGYTNLRSIRHIVETRRLRRTHVIETHPTVIALDDYDLTVVCVPSYYRKAKEVNRIIEEQIDVAKKTKLLRGSVIALVHETILGSRNDFGKRMGIDIDNADHCVELDPDLPVKYIALGDIHRPQKIKNTPNAWYCGSPIQHDFGDKGDRGILVVDLDDPTNPELLELSDVPKLVSFQVTAETKASDIPTKGHVRLDGERAHVMSLKGAPNVVATKIVVSKQSETIEDVKVSDVLQGLPEILTQMGMRPEDRQWCLTEAERNR